MMFVKVLVAIIAFPAVISLGFHGVSGYWPWQWNQFRQNGYKRK